MRSSLPIFLLCGALLASGCTSGSSVRRTEGEEPVEWEFEADFDPLSLNDDDILIAGKEMPAFGNVSGSDTAASVGAGEMVEGYRVQIRTTQDFLEADSMLSLADSLFGGEAYLQFDAPNYKVRVGNCQSRAAAEKLQIEALRLGFRTAWVLKTMVLANPPKWEEVSPAGEGE